MKKVFLYIVVILLALLFFGVYRSTDGDMGQVQVGSFVKTYNIQQKSPKNTKNTVDQGLLEKQENAIFEGEVLISEKTLLASGASEACSLAFKEGKDLPSGCQIDHIIVLKRADGEPFPVDMFAVQGNDENILYAGCRTDDDFIITSYSSNIPEISIGDKTKILDAIDKNPLLVKITKKHYDAYEPKNIHCAVFWSALEVLDQKREEENLE